MKFQTKCSDIGFDAKVEVISASKIIDFNPLFSVRLDESDFHFAIANIIDLGEVRVIAIGGEELTGESWGMVIYKIDAESYIQLLEMYTFGSSEDLEIEDREPHPFEVLEHLSKHIFNDGVDALQGASW